MEAASLVYHLSPPIQEKPRGCVEDGLCCPEGDGVGESERANNQHWVLRLGAIKPSTRLSRPRTKKLISVMSEHRKPLFYDKKSVETTLTINRYRYCTTDGGERGQNHKRAGGFSYKRIESSFGHDARGTVQRALLGGLLRGFSLSFG